MKKYLPFLTWLPNYNKAFLTSDLMAGLTVGVMLIPQGMAYAMLAGLPPIYGLYASTIPLIIYALLGTSRQLAVGPVAMVALLIASGVSGLAAQSSPEYIGYAILLALMVGIIQFGMGVFRLGFIVNFLSHPVIAGFTSAAAIIIALSQLKHLLGIDIARGKVHETLIEVSRHLQDINSWTLILGVSSIIILILVRKINKKIPGPLIVVVLGMIAVYFLQLDGVGVKILRDVPAGLAAFTMPEVNTSVMKALTPIALTIAFVGFMESIAVAKAVQAKHKDYEIDPNQELISLGLANIVGSFFKSFPVTGGFSRTAVNDQAGAKTSLSSIISALLIVLTLLFLTSYFYYLPNAVLAAIIMVAVFGLIDIKEAKHLWKTDKTDFILFMITAIATLALGIEEGVLLGVVLSLGVLIYKVSYPHMAELGRIPNSSEFRNIDRFKGLEKFDDLLIVRFDAQLFFANAQSLKDFILNRLRNRENVKHVIIEANAITGLDSTAVHMIAELDSELKQNGIELYLSNVKGPVRDKLSKNKLLGGSNKEFFFLSTADAVKSIHFRTGDNSFEEYTLQSTI